MSSLHVRLDAPHTAELDRRRLAQPIPPSRNAYASYLLGLALDGARGKSAPLVAPHLPPRTEPSDARDAADRAKGPWRTAQDDARAAAGARLKAARVAIGRTQRRLAEELGIADSTIGRIEAGKLELVGKPLAWVEEQERVANGA